jgi:hypothetical protein
MCVLCGEFVARVHWSDRRFEDGVRAAEITIGEFDRARTRDRLLRAGLANRVLSHYNLGLEDWGGSKYVLRDRTGRSELVQDLGSLWPAAEKLAGRPLDPLDPALQERILSDAGGR